MQALPPTHPSFHGLGPSQAGLPRTSSTDAWVRSLGQAGSEVVWSWGWTVRLWIGRFTLLNVHKQATMQNQCHVEKVISLTHNWKLRRYIHIHDKATETIQHILENTVWGGGCVVFLSFFYLHLHGVFLFLSSLKICCWKLLVFLQSPETQQIFPKYLGWQKSQNKTQFVFSQHCKEKRERERDLMHYLNFKKGWGGVGAGAGTPYLSHFNLNLISAELSKVCWVRLQQR